MRVKDVMATNVACCQAQTLLTDVACMMVDCDCGEIPVTDDAGRPIGVITDRDITCRAVAQGRNPLELTAADCMTSPPVTVTPEASLSECCDILEAKQIRRVPVVDQTGRCIGMVSQADIARHAPKHEAAEVLKQVSQPSVGASAIAP